MVHESMIFQVGIRKETPNKPTLLYYKMYLLTARRFSRVDENTGTTCLHVDDYHASHDQGM